MNRFPVGRAVRRITIGAAVALVVACTSTTVDVQDQPVTTVPDTPTTSTTTTPIASDVQDICGRALIWEVGASYVADCFVMPVRFAPTEPGWRSFRVGAEWIEASWVDPASREVDIRLLFLALDRTEQPEDVLDSILAIEGVTTRRGPESTRIAGREAVSADVETEPRLVGVTNRSCAGMRNAVDTFFGERPGYVLLDRAGGTDGGAAYGLGACLAFRIWTIDADGDTITVIAATDTLDSLSDVGSRVGSLLSTMSFGD